MGGPDLTLRNFCYAVGLLEGGVDARKKMKSIETVKLKRLPSAH